MVTAQIAQQIEQYQRQMQQIRAQIEDCQQNMRDMQRRASRLEIDLATFMRQQAQRRQRINNLRAIPNAGNVRNRVADRLERTVTGKSSIKAQRDINTEIDRCRRIVRTLKRRISMLERDYSTLERRIRELLQQGQLLTTMKR